MFIENHSNNVFKFIMKINNKPEFINIEPNSYIYIDEAKIEIKHFCDMIRMFEEEQNKEIIVLKGKRKNYKIGEKPIEKEEFDNRFTLMDFD